MHSASGDTPASEVSFLVNQETSKVNQNKRALLISKPEKMLCLKNDTTYYLSNFFLYSGENMRTRSILSISCCNSTLE